MNTFVSSVWLFVFLWESRTFSCWYSRDMTPSSNLWGFFSLRFIFLCLWVSYSFMFSSIPSQEDAVVFVVAVDIWGECENRSQHIFPWRPLHVCTVSRCYFEVFFSPAPRDPAVVKQHSGDFLFDLPAAIIIVSTSFSLQWCSFAAAGSISHSHQFIFYRSLERFSWILLFFDNPAPLIGNWVKDSPPFLDTLWEVEKDLWWFLGGCNTFQETTR